MIGDTSDEQRNCPDLKKAEMINRKSISIFRYRCYFR